MADIRCDRTDRWNPRMPTPQQIEERINELTEALDSHGACDCELCSEKRAEKEDLMVLRQQMTRPQREGI